MRNLYLQDEQPRRQFNRLSLLDLKLNTTEKIKTEYTQLFERKTTNVKAEYFHLDIEKSNKVFNPENSLRIF